MTRSWTVVDGAHDCGIDGIWTFVDDRYITAGAHQYLHSRANRIDLVILQAKTSSGYQETVIEKLHFHLPTLLDMGRDEEELAAHQRQASGPNPALSAHP